MNVLVISDNLMLVKFIKDQIVSHKYNHDFYFRFSSINKTPEQLISIGMKAIDIKDELVVHEVISKYDLVISAHCKQIFPENLVNNVRCINIHPGLNPYNRGWFPQVFSIINKKPAGCTIHLMNSEIDDGDILYQEEINIEEHDTSLDVYNRVVEKEKELIDLYLGNIIESNYIKREIKSKGNYNSIADFRKLKKLDLNESATLGEHIDLLRALSHGDFKNAYFLNRERKKVYLKLELELEI